MTKKDKELISKFVAYYLSHLYDEKTEYKGIKKIEQEFINA